MALQVKYFIRVKKSDNPQKEANIRVRFSNGRQFDLTAVTELQIKPGLWNNAAGTIRQRAELENEKKKKFLGDLEQLERDIKDGYMDNPDKSKVNRDWLVQIIDKFHNPNKYLQDNTNLFGYIQYFIDNSTKRINPDTGNPVCYKMRREYQVTFDYLKKYAEKYGEPDFIDIDLEFYQQFVDFLRNYEERDKEGNIIKSGLAINTIGKKVQTLKIFLNAATEQGINHYMKYKSRNFKSLSEESDNIYLTKEELKKFYEHDFSDRPGLERVRDLFIVASHTGVRYSDLQQITTDKIEGDYIYIRQKKTGKKVVIPLHTTVIKILNKYKGKLPKPISNQKYNEFLKNAAQIAEINSMFTKTLSHKGMRIEKRYPKHKLISSHTARRSFCTNAYKDGLSTLSIMAISGHKTEKAFLKYIKVSDEEHANKMLNMWRKNGEHISIAK